ncbi:MAG: DUF1926 domain-containing protein [Candidatus Omnitrophica bacterium]|nr:DUF1926 domain-containing protein [Candidatus Omnitrophota bacterium]
MGKVYLLLVIHNHQPCDNFGWVIEDAFQKAYKPFIDVLEKYPDIKVALHYSGSLFEWIDKNRPQFFDRIKKLICNGQIELLSGGFYEPILSLLSENDRISQIQQMNDFIKERFLIVPKGLWLTERVWDPDLVTTFNKTGLSYTMLDNNHFKKAGINAEIIKDYYVLNTGFKVFCGNKTLRYIMPFGKVSDVKNYFSKARDNDKDTCLVFSDDGEKFGFWPKTYDWVYKKKWLESFFDMLSENKDLIETITPEAIFTKKEGVFLKNIPAASYSEMEQWANGHFENFLLKYPEVERMHKRMGLLSLRICDLEKKHGKDPGNIVKAKKQLFMSQTGCVYWHGVFGGFYLNHLREGFYRHIINAEKYLDELEPKSNISEYGQKEDLVIRLDNNDLSLHIKPGRRGEIVEIDCKDKSLNIVNTVSRKVEPYHDKIKKRSFLDIVSLKKQIQDRKFFNIYDLLGSKKKCLAKVLAYDKSDKSAFIDKFIFGKYSIKDMIHAKERNLQELSVELYEVVNINKDGKRSVEMHKTETVQHADVSFDIKKEIGLEQSNSFYVLYELKNIGVRKAKGFFATEVNLSIYNEKMCCEQQFKNVNNLFLNDQWTSSQISIKISEPVDIWIIPVYTVNESEEGLDRTYQYSRMLFMKKVCLVKEEKNNLKFEIKVT